MSVEVLNEMDEMNSLIDKYLTEDDKALIHGKVRGAKVKSISQNNQFLLHSVATKVKSFVQDGHFTAFMAYGLDYMVLGESSTFTLSGFTDIEELSEFTYSYCVEWNESQTGGIDEHMLDLIYVWLLTSPYVAMSMTEKTREVLHDAVEFLWLDPATDNNSLYSQCYEDGKRFTNEPIQHWIDNAPIMYKGCGYENIIKSQEC